MPYSCLSGPVGHQQVAFFGLPDTTERVQPGLDQVVVDPYWGGAEVVYVKAGGTIRMGAACVITPVLAGGKMTFVASEVPNTANLGRPVYFAMTPMTIGQFGYCIQSGLTVALSNATVAADTAIGIVAAGQLGANAAGKQILGARNALAATTTVAKASATANSGSTKLTISGADGWFIGAYLSGTGIAAATIITDIDPSGTQVTLSVATTAAVNGTVTATYNNATIFYNVVHINRPMAQGPIT